MMDKQPCLKLLTAICAIAAAGMALGAVSDLPVLDSSKFEFKYEMDVLPTEQDLDGDGYKDFIGGGAWLTLQGNGTARFDMHDNANYIKSDTAVGHDGCVWQRYAPRSDTGYTVEVRMRVIELPQGKTMAAALTSSESNCDLVLTFANGSLIWGTDSSAKIANFATTNAFHTYRVARLPSENHYVLWCDGTLVTNSLNDALSNTGLNRLLLGAIGGNFRSLAEVDYLRFTKGAYAPKQTMMDSAEFAHKYEMNSLDEGLSPVESTAAWTINDRAEGTATMENGILSADMPNTKMRYWRTAGPMDEFVTTYSSFTFESRVRIKESWHAGGPALNFLVGVSGASCLFNIGENSVQWRKGEAMETIHSGDDYTDKMHVFRVTQCAGVFTLWCDGVKIGENLAVFDRGSTYNYARFGVVSQANGGSYEIDYIRWTTDGAFIPFVPPKGTTIMFK